MRSTHGVVVALDQLGLVDQITGLRVVPTRLRVVLPADQPGGPGQLEHTGGRQFVVDLHLEAGARRAVRPDLGAADDHHQVGRVDVEVGPFRRRCRGVAARRRRQRGDGALGLGRRRPRRPTAIVPARAPWRPARPCRAWPRQPAGQVRLDRRTGRGDLGLHVAQGQQHRGHLVGGVGGDAGLLDGGRRWRRCGPSARCRGSSRSARAPG